MAKEKSTYTDQRKTTDAQFFFRNLHSGCLDTLLARPPGAVSSVSVSRARGPGFDTQTGHMLSFFLWLIQEGHLPVTG